MIPHRLMIAIALTVTCIGICLPHSGLADVVYLKDGSILYGQLVDQNDETIVFNQRIIESFSDNPKDKQSAIYREKIIRADEVAALLVNIRPKRLAALDPSDPAAYRDLAEELAPQKSDPEARELAIRLFLVAAKRGGKSVQSTSFSALVQLARSPEEAKRLRALAHIYVPNGNWLTHAAETSHGDSSAKPALTPEQGRLLNALVALRQGDKSTAITEINSEQVSETIQPYRSICSLRELRVWCSATELKTEWLARILELEIAIRFSTTGSDYAESIGADSRDWSRLIYQAGMDTAAIDFSNVTEFDPDKAWFRNGKWTVQP